jgi:hypothetical protein
MKAEVVVTECCHGTGRPPELIGADGAPATPEPATEASDAAA